MKVSAAGAVAMILVGSGCGHTETRAYVLPPTRSCVQEFGTVDYQLDTISSEATDGAFRLDVDGKEAMVAFGADEAEGKDIAGAYEAVPGETVDRHGNAVIAWTDAPNDQERGQVAGCLASDSAFR